MKIPLLVAVCVIGCGKSKPPEPASGSGSAVAVAPKVPPPVAIDAAAPLIDAAIAIDAAELDAAPPIDAAVVEEVKLGAPVALSGPFKGLVVQPVGDWVVKEKPEQVLFHNPCCEMSIQIKPSSVKLASIDDLKKQINELFPVMGSVTDVVEHHDVPHGFWALVKGPSAIFEGDIDTGVLQVAHFGARTFVCTALLDVKTGHRDIRPDELVATCSTLRAK